MSLDQENKIMWVFVFFLCVYLILQLLAASSLEQSLSRLSVFLLEIIVRKRRHRF